MDAPTSPIIELKSGGKSREFDLNNAKLPNWLEEAAQTSGGYPYEKNMKRGDYENKLEGLQEELVKVLSWLQNSGERVMIIFEGRDAAGKGGTINRFRQYMNPRHARTVALSKPSDVERGQWYFQRYVDHFPTSGELVMFDRSWYNRAGVEPVMGFCSEQQHANFLDDAPAFEKMITDEGIHLFKFWLNVGREMQLLRFHERRHSSLKMWKLSPIDIKALTKWDEYTVARDTMLAKTHAPHAPWSIIRTNDKKRGRINAISRVLSSLDYKGKKPGKIYRLDDKISGEGPDFLNEFGA